ncbi:MAG: hypothetical protein WBA66_08690 [Xanthobacteraceae bacterium]|jgi:hypothetical protein
MRQIWFLLLVILTLAPPAAAQTPRIDELVILERGLYQAATVGPSHYVGTAGPIHTVDRAKLHASTTSVPADRFTRFGVRYLVKGEPNGALIELRMVTRFPEVGVLDPHTNRRYIAHEYRLPVRIGVPGYREYNLDQDSERITGEWTFEFWVGERKLREQSFCLFSSDEPAASSACTVVLGANQHSSTYQ